MASGARPPTGSEPRAAGPGGARSPGRRPDAGPRRPPASSLPFPGSPRPGTSSVPAAAAAAEARAPPPLTPCDSRGPLDVRGALAHLHVARSREARVWRGGSLQPETRDAFRRVVVWLLQRENAFHFAPTTFNLALCIFGRLLVSAKVAEGHLHCALITSLRLAAKLNEEEESIPHVNDFINHYGPSYSRKELLRMELVILDKLHWDLHTGTPLDFLNIFHALVILSQPRVMDLLPQTKPSRHVASLTRQLQHCMAGHQLLQFKGSTLALVIITLEFERLKPGCCDPISDLLKKAQVDIEQYELCKELVQQHLRSLPSSSHADN